MYAYDDPIETRTSRCMDVPGFKPVDGSPSRSPLNVADYLLRETEGKTLTEVGSRNGDLLACITHFKVNEEKLPAPVSVELDREYCDKMRARGIEVRCDPIEDLGEDTLPISDVYFWWPMAAKTQNTAWLRHIGGVLQKKGVAKGKLAIVACDPQWAEDRDNSYELRDWMGESGGQGLLRRGRPRPQFGGFRMIHVPLDFPFPSEEEVAEGKRKAEEKRREAAKAAEEEERRRKQRRNSPKLGQNSIDCNVNSLSLVAKRPSLRHSSSFAASASITSLAALSPAATAPSTCPNLRSVSVPAKCTPHPVGAHNRTSPYAEARIPPPSSAPPSPSSHVRTSLIHALWYTSSRCASTTSAPNTAARSRRTASLVASGLFP